MYLMNVSEEFCQFTQFVHEVHARWERVVGYLQAYGLVLLLASLILDGMTGPRQEEVRTYYI